MQNIRLTLQYDGTRYLGWQRPKKDGFEKTVSYKVTTALSRMTGEDITLYPGAKTDPGVHARSQTVSFLTGSSLSPEQIRAELNRFLPQDIAVLSSGTAPERFRADLNAKSRTYGYRICTSPVYDIFTAAFTACISPCPDISRMEAAAALEEKGIHAEVINMPTLKPLDTACVLASVKKTGRVLTCEEHQLNGGLGDAVANFLVRNYPVPMEMVGVDDRFGQSGTPQELLDHYGLNVPGIVAKAEALLARK